MRTARTRDPDLVPARRRCPDRPLRAGRHPRQGVANRSTAELSSPLARAWAKDLLTERNLDIAEEAAKIAAGLGSTSTAVALAWVRQRPGVTSVIIGPRTLDQLTGNLAGFALDLPADAIARLDEISDAGA
ncbi:aldo/keto reductase [Kitasatospora aburaviensis]